MLGRSRKLEFMVVAQTATTTSRAAPNARQDKAQQENYAERDERSIHVGTKKVGQSNFIESYVTSGKLPLPSIGKYLSVSSSDPSPSQP
jgi:hypothetical protein